MFENYLHSLQIAKMMIATQVRLYDELKVKHRMTENWILKNCHQWNNHHQLRSSTCCYYYLIIFWWHLIKLIRRLWLHERMSTRKDRNIGIKAFCFCNRIAVALNSSIKAFSLAHHFSHQVFYLKWNQLFFCSAFSLPFAW